MQCVTIKSGVECAFMTRKGCTFNGGRCHPVVEACEGCSRNAGFSDGNYCTICPQPSTKWTVGSCNFATHIERSATTKEQKLNPLKASKRAAAGKKS